MHHVVDCKDFVSEPVMKLREKYGLVGGYGMYAMARNLLFTQRLKMCENDRLSKLLMVHTGKSSSYINQFIEDCIKYKALSEHHKDGKRFIYSMESILWYLTKAFNSITRRMRLCVRRGEKKEYVELYDTFKDVLEIDWANSFTVNSNLKKFRNIKEEEDE